MVRLQGFGRASVVGNKGQAEDGMDTRVSGLRGFLGILTNLLVLGSFLQRKPPEKPPV